MYGCMDVWMYGTEDNIIEISLVVGQQQPQPTSQVTTNISQVCTHHLAISNAGTTSTSVVFLSSKQNVPLSSNGLFHIQPILASLHSYTVTTDD